MSKRLCVRSVVTCAAVAVVSASLLSSVRAQVVEKRFDVASVKPSKASPMGGLANLSIQPGGRVTARAITLQDLIAVAYKVNPTQIVDAPHWVARDRFDVEAKAEGNVPPAEMRERIASLLRDRFHLVMHRDSRQQSVYALVKNRQDGKLGPQLHAAAGQDCVAKMTEPRVPSSSPDAPLACGLRIGPGWIRGAGMAISQLVQSMQPQVARLIVDKTGLSGAYDWELRWHVALSATPDQGDSETQTLEGALREQLGLKLESQQAFLEAIVIDSVSQPEPD